MKKEITVEEGKLIVEFLGGKYVGIEKLDGIGYHMYDLPASFPCMNQEPDMFGMKRTGYLGFKVSWDWLMPVVEKIGDTRLKSTASYNPDLMFRIEIVNGYTKISGTGESIFANSCIEGSMLLATWKCVVQFVTWYNSQVSGK